ncbi:F-type H+-transporting ATPase subunit epsilon [Mycoplasmopsis mustelae]|uniref:ATP synthase epsilon chain n=1 Tax=Mycoplasmopsis mustelae TaxID=171289 RepID=A0A4R7UCF1_9BACT|nr:ATP synthase F1 subunit epsilon [Mycoplasmopsis mustelae]TDV24098.1 F-type H+-transporting ATPase subunit epsilon [Mycoplasmopsis mustelae]
MNKTHLKITAPNGIFYEGDIHIVTLRTANGYIGIQPNRAPLFSSIEIGTLTIGAVDGQPLQSFYIGGGIIYADRSKINIITDDIINAKEIDIKRAQDDVEFLSNSIKNNKDTVDLVKLETKLKKALFRVQTYNLFNK